MSLETFKFRWPKNAPGRFYVDAGCLDCNLCRLLAPSVFVFDDERGCSYVARQPETPEEISLCLEAVARCPQEDVHEDGLQFDWQMIPPVVPWFRPPTRNS